MFKRKMTTLAAAGLFTALGLYAGLGPKDARASSHREAPLIAEDPAADATDLYAFRTPSSATDYGSFGNNNTVVIVANYWPLEEPGGGPNWPRFSDGVLYEIKIDNDGDAVEDITYQFRFRTEYLNPGTFLLAGGPVAAPGDQNLYVRQHYTVTRVDKSGNSTVLLNDQLTPPVYTGDFTMSAYQAMADTTVYPLGGDAITNGRVFAGQRDDPFFVDLGAIFDLVRLRCQNGGGYTPNTALGCGPATGAAPGTGSGNVKGVDFVGGYNVHTLALQIPITQLLKSGAAPSGKDQVLGIWTTASRQRVTIRRAPPLTSATKVKTQDSAGPWVQVSRLGLPLINEVVLPLALKDYYNSMPPSSDAAVFTSAQGGPLLTNPLLAQALAALYGVNVPAAGRTDIVQLVQFHISMASDGSNPIGPFKGMTYGLTPADILRLDVSLPPPTDFSSNPKGALGVVAGTTDANIGFPNGRRLQDDVVDIEESVISGVLRNAGANLGDGVNANDQPFMTHFPYLATPWSGSKVNLNAGPYPQLHTAQ